MMAGHEQRTAPVEQRLARQGSARPAGLLEKLLAAIRPEFRRDDLIFDPRHPVFGGPACAVTGCDRPARSNRMCWGHRVRWDFAGKPDLTVFLATTSAEWVGHRPVTACRIGGCGFGLHSQGTCQRHTRQWKRHGRPELLGWVTSATPLPPPSPPPGPCRIEFCDLWKRGTSAFCANHDNRWKARGRPDIDEFTASYQDVGPGGSEHIDLRRLPAQLRLEVQYMLQCRHDEATAKIVPAWAQQLHQHLREQQQRLLEQWPCGVSVLFPRRGANLRGDKPISTSGYRCALAEWLKRCDTRDELGRPVHLTPHQFRHTLGTRLINKDVPQDVVRQLLDHTTGQMTSHYARLSDATVRRHWEKARKVNIQGDTVALDPNGPLAEAAWAKQRISRATQALPNGYCGLPVVQSCPHANSCLTCPMFLTTEEFLPQHHEHHRQTLQIISAAEARGQGRLAEMNRQVADNLANIITSLEDDRPENQDTDADAS